MARPMRNPRASFGGGVAKAPVAAGVSPAEVATACGDAGRYLRADPAFDDTDEVAQS